jgi:hypothetical protein
MISAARTASGSDAKSREDDSHPGDQVRDLTPRAGTLLDRRAGHPSGSDHASEERRDHVGDAVRPQLLVRIDLVAVLLGELLRHAQRFAEGEQEDPDGR